MKKLILILAILVLTFGMAHAQGRRFREFQNTSPKAGEKAPDFICENEKGEKIVLSQLKGKKHVVLIFGAIT